MKIDLIAPNGCGIRHDKRLRKLILTAENVKDQEELYRLAGRITIGRNSLTGMCPPDGPSEQPQEGTGKWPSKS